MPARLPPNRVEAAPSNRTLVGFAALACGLISLLAFVFVSPNNAAPFMRVGLVLGALWLATPANGRLFQGRTVATIVVACLVAVALRGRMLLYVLPLLAVAVVAAVLIRPKTRR